MKKVNKEYFSWDKADEEEKKAKTFQNFYKNLIIKNGCWESKRKDDKGYGRCEIGRKKYTLLHRASYEIFVGPIPEGMQINHRCHNPQCCRPSHLYLGTQQDNINDQVERGTFPKGSKHGNAKITEEAAKEIKLMLNTKKYLHREIAEIYGISRDLVKDISRGRTWKHVTIE